MVDQVQRLGKRVLVVVPHVFVSEVEGAAPTLTQDDQVLEPRLIETDTNGSTFLYTHAIATIQRILDKLEASQSLYVVPPDTRSSRFWLYATLYEGRRTPAMVVSNDSLLEHRALFPDIRSFQRWRAQHLVTYKFTRRAMPPHKRPRNYQPPVLTLNAPGTRILSIVHINTLTVTTHCSMRREIVTRNAAQQRQLAHPSHGSRCVALREPCSQGPSC